MAMRKFEEVFKTDSKARNNFLARLFGLFNEQIVIHWCGCAKADFVYLGRPTVRRTGETDKKQRWTLDFALQSKHDGAVFVAEMKCWVAYDGGRHLRLRNANSIEKFLSTMGQGRKTFQAFLDLAANPNDFVVSIESGGPKRFGIKAAGSILVWGAVTDEGCTAVCRPPFNIARVLSVEQMLEHLHECNNGPWMDCVAQYRTWTDDLFGYLSSKPSI